MNIQPISPWRRPLLGFAAGGLLLFGAILAWLPAGPNTASREVLQGSCFKAGIVLVLLWLAMPQIDRLPHWAVFGTTGALLLLAVRPQALLVLVRLAIFCAPLLFLAWLFRPKRRGPPGARPLASRRRSAYIADDQRHSDGMP